MNFDHHPPCPGGCGELADECMTPGCGSPLGSMHIVEPVGSRRVMNLLRTDYGDGASHPALVILGVDTGGTVWVDRDGYRLDFPADVLALMRQVVADESNVTGTVLRHGFRWDESQVDSLIRAQFGPTLHTCRDCGTRPIVERVDDRCTECGDAAEARSDEISYTRRLG